MGAQVTSRCVILCGVHESKQRAQAVSIMIVSHTMDNGTDRSVFFTTSIFHLLVFPKILVVKKIIRTLLLFGRKSKIKKGGGAGTPNDGRRRASNAKGALGSSC